jgi:hypothetical protein
MAIVDRETEASAADVWAVLADGWRYPVWVVGAARMRAVEAAWPAVGSRLHHSVGTWPVLLSDTTVVLESEPARRLKIQARGWPLGEATVELVLQDLPGGGCSITMAEHPAAGPGKMLANPLTDRLLAARNRETLRRLAEVAEARTSPG